jgi:hypothetical protein
MLEAVAQQSAQGLAGLFVKETEVYFKIKKLICCISSV